MDSLKYNFCTVAQQSDGSFCILLGLSLTPAEAKRLAKPGLGQKEHYALMAVPRFGDW